MCPENKLKISRILHAGYIFEHQKSTIAFDPIFENPFSRNCYAFPSVKFDLKKINDLKFDAVFISHFHDDHCSLESLNLLDRKTPIYLYCLFEEMAALIRQLGFEQVHSLRLDETIYIDSIKVTAIKALDFEVDSMFHIQAAGLNVLNVVDSLIDPQIIHDLSLTAPWDLVMWPFQTMLETDVLSPSRAQVLVDKIPSEWISQLALLKPKYLVASACQFQQESWSWYNHALFPISYREFKTSIEEALPSIEVCRLNPGVSIFLEKNSLNTQPTISPAPPLEWVHPIGEQNVDYDYRPHQKPPSTLELSRNFLALSRLQLQKVFAYCRVGLLERYQSLDRANDSFFWKKQIWQLSIFDHLGQPTIFQYQIEGTKIQLITEVSSSVSWTTEIPLAKFWAALFDGESLTSLYIRINDQVFSPEIEKELEFVDLLNDPLIRCLYTDQFGTYQKAQLVKILSRENR